MRKSSLKSLRNKAWKLFSEYVRRKDADWRGNVICYTCLKQIPWKESQASHRWHNKLDYDERNVHACCVRCNNWLHGNLGLYERRIIEENGIEFAKKLQQDAAQEKPLKKPDLELIIAEVSRKLKLLDKT